MRITLRIPDNDLAEAMRFTRTKSASKAIIAAVADFNRRKRMEELIQHAGTCNALITAEELQAQRRQG